MSTPSSQPITGAPGSTPTGQASEIHWSSFRYVPEAASNFAGPVDTIMIFWLIFSAVLMALVFGLITAFVLRYYNRGVSYRKLRKKTRSGMEWSWTIALGVIGLGIGVWADYVYFEMHYPPPDATPVYVVAKQWMWKMQHTDGTREINALHIPVNEPVKLIMSSQDVIHSFFVPEFRVKQDVVPGRYNYLWFTPTRVGEYHLFCSQYCGTSHSKMTGVITVMTPQDFQEWKRSQVSGRAGQTESSLAARGRSLFTAMGCISCHGTGGRIAPQLQGLFMSRVGLRTGEAVLADEQYLRESILNPAAKIVQGYPNIMPSFQGQLSEEDLLSLIVYIKSLQHYDKVEP